MRASRSLTGTLIEPASRVRASAAVPAALLAVALTFAVVPQWARAADASESPRRTLSELTVSPEVEVAELVPSSAGTRPAPKARISKRTAARPASPRPSSAPAASRSGSTGGWQSARVSWYGPGFYGRTMAGGGTLERDSMVVAHRSLPFGTRIMFEYGGRSCTAVVRDRGPYAGGRVFDLGPGTAHALGFSGVGTVRYRILGR